MIVFLFFVKLKSILLNKILEFNEKARPKSKVDKNRKSDTYESLKVFNENRELTLNPFKSGIFLIKLTEGKWCPLDLASHPKILTPK